MQDGEIEGWTPEALVRWLDRQVRQPDISQRDMLRWLTELAHHLVKARGIGIAALMRCKFILARRVIGKIEAARERARKDAYQTYLFKPEAKVAVSYDADFQFKQAMYQGEKLYRGNWKPAKHFLGADRVPAFDGAENGEELQCAQAIDGLPQVKYWVRNIARNPESFSLPTATGSFYPDFVSQLEDGRLLVVEYKGAHLADNVDTAEKRAIGELWERHSQGQALFLLAEKSIDGKSPHQQLAAKIEL